MKIELTPDQYRTLLKLAYLGKYLSGGFHPDFEEEEDEDDEDDDDYEYDISDKPTAPINEFFQYILSHHAEFEEFDWVTRDGKSKELKLPDEVEMEIFAHVEYYDNFVFWQELASRLAERDMELKYGEDGLAELDLADELNQEAAIIEQYEQEFAEHGIQNLKLINPSWN